MKNKIILVLIMIVLSTINRSYSQDSCKVFKPEISGKYVGKCKKGMANGQGMAIGVDKYEGRFKNGLPNGHGKYTWANGNTYNGYWKNGMRHGEGTITYKVNGADSILTGIWEKDLFVKKLTPPQYKIFIARDFDKYTITREHDGNKISLKLRQNGMPNNAISNFSFYADNGAYQVIGSTYVYLHVIFPVKVKISYTTANKLKTSILNPVLEVTINEPGEWEIVLTN